MLNNVHEKGKNPKNTPLIFFADLEGLRNVYERLKLLVNTLYHDVSPGGIYSAKED